MGGTLPVPDNTPTPPNISSTTPSDPPDCEATSWEEQIIEATMLKPIEDQGGGGGGSASCMLVLPSINWKALQQITDGSEIVVLPEKPLKPQEDSSNHFSDGETD
uniref:Uncharacterized protein n=1 Tax=Amphimedon queenslandica TaxID=400682 RepID=A0A1X7TDS6_AMPQE